MKIHKVGVVIPCFRVKKHILSVIDKIGPEVTRVYIVDDCCPDGTGVFVLENCHDTRIRVLFNEVNQGVGGAVVRGYQAAIDDDIDIIVKIDGDGQMDPLLIKNFIYPITLGLADYTKGNRFFNLDKILEMPKIRLFGNAILSFLTKISSGYWDLFDPTNGYTAIHITAAKMIPFEKVSKRYFFETDMLFRLNCVRAVVIDVPMNAIYGDEVSNLKVSNVVGEFLIKNLRNFLKRIFYNYYLRDMSVASIELPCGLLLLSFGLFFGIFNWWKAIELGSATTTGTVMLSVLPVLIGLQFLLSFINYDIKSRPTIPLQRLTSIEGEN